MKRASFRESDENVWRVYRIWLPSVSRGATFPPVDGAPVLAPVKQTALDCGCGQALGQGVGNAASKGLGRR